MTLPSDIGLTGHPFSAIETPAIVTGAGLKFAAICACLVPFAALAIDGWKPAVAALGTVVCFLACFSLQFVGLSVMRRPGRVGMILTAAGYFVRLGGLGVLLWAQTRFEFVTPGVQTTWVFIAGVTMVVAWLAGVFISARRVAPWLETQGYEPRADWGELA
jgi:hypothetical protein